MEKIKINLNPEKATLFDEKLEKLLDYTPLLVLLAAFFILVLGGIEAVNLVKANQYNNYKKTWQVWKPKHREFLRIKKEIAALKRKEKKLKEAVFGRDKGKLLLESLYFALPKNIWLSNFSFRGNQAGMEGYAVQWQQGPMASVGEFVKSLQEDESYSGKFSKIKIKDTKKTDFNNVEVTQFLIECKK